MRVPSLFVALGALFLSACASTGPAVTAPRATQAAAEPDRVVILVSIDGFRAEYFDRGVTPNLAKLAASGVHARRMIPAFPSLTFPNHYTIATGRRPDHNGIVGNQMEDPRLPGRSFSLGNRAEATDPVWWNEAEPIWVTAKKQGVKVATMFWPGSESAIQGVRPDYWLPYEESISSQARVNMLLGWLSLPPAERPRFATLYFDAVDTNGHRAGPNSEQVTQALGEVDSAIGKLVDALAARKMAADIVVVSDHGMTDVSADRVVFLDDVADANALHVVSTGSNATLGTTGEGAAKAEAALLGPHPHFTCWKKGEVPARFDFGTNTRVPPIVCLADTGWLIATHAKFNPAYAKGGAHGYDNRAPDMAALFLASGPDVKSGVTLDEIDNVDVYPFVARLLQVAPLPNQGDANKLAPAMR